MFGKVKIKMPACERKRGSIHNMDNIIDKMNGLGQRLAE